MAYIPISQRNQSFPQSTELNYTPLPKRLPEPAPQEPKGKFGKAFEVITEGAKDFFTEAIPSVWDLVAPEIGAKAEIGIQKFREQQTKIQLAEPSINQKIKLYSAELPEATLSMFTNIGSGILGSAESGLGALQWVGVDEAKPIADKLSDWQDVVRPENPTFADQLQQGIGSMAAFYLPGAGAMKMSTLIAGFSPKAALWAGSSAMTFLESAAEAGETYRESMELGEDRQAADSRATGVFWTNIALLGITNKLGIFGEGKNVILKLLMSSGMEGVQEFAQEVTQNVTFGRQWDLGAYDAGKIGAILGLFGGAGISKVREQDVQLDPKLVQEALQSQEGFAKLPSFENRLFKKEFAQSRLDDVARKVNMRLTDKVGLNTLEAQTISKNIDAGSLTVTNFVDRITNKFGKTHPKLDLIRMTAQETVNSIKTQTGGDPDLFYEAIELPGVSKALQKRQVAAIQTETMAKAKQVYDQRVKKIKTNKDILDTRRSMIKAIKSHFNLSDSDLKGISRRDIRLMTNGEFRQYLDKVRERSVELADQRQAKNELLAQIKEKDIDIEPLRKAMGLPSISNMNTTELHEFFVALEPYQKNDVFLSQRKLETINRTELEGIKTYREARERLAKKLNVSEESLKAIEVSEFDRFRGDIGLAERNPFYKMMVENTAKLQLVREQEFLDIEKETFRLTRGLKTTLGEKLVPRQPKLVEWFEAKDKSKVKLNSAEVELVSFMQKEWSKARDYLIKINAMDKGLSSQNYFTHVRRGILEAITDDGVTKAVKEVFNQYKLDEQKFDIMDRDTGQVLAMDKFFRFAMHRTGQLTPSSNVVRAFTNYMRTFKKKQALDEIVPLIDIYANSLTPPGLSKEGLLLHGNLMRFTKEWLNTKKGRRVSLIAKQGGKLEFALRSLRTFTTFFDIGFNLAVTAATQVGEQAITYQLLGKKKYATSKVKAATPKGRRIINKYRNFIGKNPWGELVEPAKAINNRFSEGVFVLFSDANIRRNKNFLIGSLTKEEWQSETISPERLAHLRTDLGRYGMLEGAKSIFGATPEGGQVTQYKTWALPIMRTAYQNILNLRNLLAKDPKKKMDAKRAALETYRIAELTTLVLIIKAMADIDKDCSSMLCKIKERAFLEATTLTQAMNPSLFFSVPRNFSFVEDLSKNLTSLVKLEQYEQSRFGEYEAGELKGLRRLKLQFSPRAIKQFQRIPEKTEIDIANKILEDIQNGVLSEEAAEKKWLIDIKALENKNKKKRFELSVNEYAQALLKEIKAGNMDEADAEDEWVEYQETNKEVFNSPNEETFIDKIKTYGEAIGTDPVTAFHLMFQGEIIRRTDNGAIIVFRGKTREGLEQKDWSLEKRKEFGATKGFILDHIISLQLGGTNADSNLKVVSEEEWKRYTPIENYLGRKLREGLIDGDEAEDLIVKFKNGELKAEQIVQ